MKRGDVVEVDWLYTNMTGSTARPAVVVQADFLNGLIDDSVLVQITSTHHGIPGTEVELDPALETGSGLSKVCYASCTNVLTIEQGKVLRNVGYLSDAIKKQMEACLKVVLEIPYGRAGTTLVFRAAAVGNCNIRCVSAR
jgi:mRNA-degrading endonuclease toxin of MazEF toxin-antitoxin module